MQSYLNKLDELQIGLQALTKDLKSRDVDQVTELVNLLMKDMKSIASAFQDPNSKELSDSNLLTKHHKLLQLTEFDAKLAYSEVDRDEAFKYPWMTVSNCEQRFKMLDLSIQYFADHMKDAGPGMRACLPPFTNLVAEFKGTVMEYLKLRHRRIAMRLDPAAEVQADYPDTNKEEWAAKKQQWVDALTPEWESGAIQVIMIEPKKLLNSPWSASKQYDEESDRPTHPLLQWCKLDLMDREEGVLYWSLGGVVAWRFCGEDEWMDRYGHVIDECEYK
ncbi:uncharacterized protein FFB20_05431 [Fusarium fujikuroi]|nr:uncharacterized protein Y057_10326 [Fusarium fujikuroi]SCN76957.1 uncharacterized protein FFB20_05431 [Fusarium fujikuroi]SCO19408.1 uncharacterized protein FFE2_14299 [Fusarium fujikuroi]SCO25347.1 uncharacterized protein FFC1_15460 [Fusarium fujikuroi]SCO52473.1 uncharacterized protein FFNC_14304 [Fusarium fujikuroi]